MYELTNNESNVVVQALLERSKDRAWSVVQ